MLTSRPLNTLFLTFCFFQLTAQADWTTEQLLGVWELEMEVIDHNYPGLTIELPGEAPREPASKDTLREQEWLYFQPDNLLDVVAYGDQYKFNYTLRDAILDADLNQYQIKELTDDRLVMEKVAREDELDIGLSTSTLYYRRSDRRVEPLPLSQRIEDTYPNGQLRRSGLEEMGLAAGTWTSWYEDGRIKSVELFHYGMLIMEITYDRAGHITGQRWLDVRQGQWREE
jgi:hypothetical protein